VPPESRWNDSLKTREERLAFSNLLLLANLTIRFRVPTAGGISGGSDATAELGEPSPPEKTMAEPV